MPRQGIALFGLGRAGKIHFGNIVASHRMSLLYVVEAAVDEAKSFLAEFNQPDVKVVHPSEADTVYKDDKWVSTEITYL